MLKIIELFAFVLTILLFSTLPYKFARPISYLLHPTVFPSLLQ